MSTVVIHVEMAGAPDRRIHEKDALYGQDHFFGEAHSETVTLKVTPGLKHKLVSFAKAEGYTNLSVTLRELILLGIEYYPEKARTMLQAKLDALEEFTRK